MQTILDAICKAYFAENRKVISNGRAHRVHHTQGKPHTVGQTAAIVVGASVSFGANELANAIAVAEMNFYRIETGCFH